MLAFDMTNPLNFKGQTFGGILGCPHYGAAKIMSTLNILLGSPSAVGGWVLIRVTVLRH